MKSLIDSAVTHLISVAPFLLHTEGTGKDYKMSTARILELLLMALAVGVINYYSIQSLESKLTLMLANQRDMQIEDRKKLERIERDFYLPRGGQQNGH